MPKIQQLSSHEAQKIAAGEVVERPANIVKELLENAIDAGATRITLFVSDGGKTHIRVVDNGCGMDASDAQKCFDRHATSKITHVNDLETITTFGFRGEALASIAAVSKITLITKENNTIEGAKVIIQSNTIQEVIPAACTTGTDISIDDLFYNVPARKKFLKSTQTEWRAIQLLYNAFCFDYPTIHFTLYSDNRQILNCPPAASLLDRALQIWELKGDTTFIPIEHKTPSGYTIEGIISDHQCYRYDRSSIYIFVNKRWVKNHHITSALIKGYSNVIPEGRYPLGALNITVPLHEVDINIHPRKEEVKFLHPRIIEQGVHSAVKTALEHSLSSHLKKPAVEEAFRPQHFSSSQAFSQSSFAPFDFTAFFNHNNSFNSQETSTSTPQPTSVVIPHTPEQMTTTAIAIPQSIPHTKSDISSLKPAEEYYTIIGNYNKTYILIEKEDGLFLIDQHAAHERILYEEFAHKLEDISTVQLLFPSIITFSQTDIDYLIPYLPLVNSHGIIAEQYGSQQIIVSSTPVHLKNASIEDLIHSLIGWIIEHKTLTHEECTKIVTNKLQAQMACKAAVKAGDTLTQEQMRRLVTDLYKTTNRLTCPHGRPTGWLLSLYEIEKKFKRKV